MLCKHSAAEAFVCRLPTAAGSKGQLNNSCAVVQQHTDPSQARDADIVNAFLAKGPTSVATAAPSCVPGKLAAAVLPAQHASGYMGAASAWTYACTQKEMPLPPGPGQITGLGNSKLPTSPPAGTSK